MRISTTPAPVRVEPATAHEYLAQLPVAYAPGAAILAMPRGAERRAAIVAHLDEAERRAMADVSGPLASLREAGVLAGWRLLPHTGVLVATAADGQDAAARQALEAIERLGDVVTTDEAPPPPPLPGPVRPVAPTPEQPWQLDQIKARDAWKTGARGQGMTIGFVDSGALMTHPELAGRQRGDGAPGARPWIDLIDGDATAADPYGHGTAVTSVAVGATTGAAPDARFVTARVFGDRPNAGKGTLATKLEGIGWMLAPTRPDGTAADPAAAPDIVNTSFGEHTERQGIFRTALQALEDAGVLVVAAVGNGGRRGPGNVLAPAIYDSVLAVGMTDSTGAIDDRTAFGGPSLPSGRPKPDLVAPGADVRAATIEGGYTASSGTSLASAVASGAAAVVWSAAPTLLPAQVRDVLRRTAVNVGTPGSDPREGAGLIDLDAAVQLARTIGGASA
jgi:bacillopeptidase F